MLPYRERRTHVAGEGHEDAVWPDIGGTALVHRRNHSVSFGDGIRHSLPACTRTIAATASIADMVAHVLCGNGVSLCFMAHRLAHLLWQTADSHPALAAETH